MKYHGGCHCGAVEFEVEAPEHLHISECNCSICCKTGYWHLIVERSDFRLVKGADSLSHYRFNTGVAEHSFCRICGIKSFYTPRSHPEGVSVNARCISPLPTQITLTPFDGQNWEDNVDRLRQERGTE